MRTYIQSYTHTNKHTKKQVLCKTTNSQITIQLRHITTTPITATKTVIKVDDDDDVIDDDDDDSGYNEEEVERKGELAEE